MSLIKLANFEEQEGSKCGQYSDVGLEARAIAADSRRVGAALLRCRRLGRLAVGYVAQALAPLHDELALAPAAVAALRERESALLTTHLLREDIEKKGAAARGLEEAGALRLGGSTAKAKRVAQLQDEVAAAEAALTVADAEYARVKARNVEVRDVCEGKGSFGPSMSKSRYTYRGRAPFPESTQELERWSAAKARDYKAMAGAFANVCFKYEERSKEVCLGRGSRGCSSVPRAPLTLGSRRRRASCCVCRSCRRRWKKLIWLPAPHDQSSFYCPKLFSACHAAAFSCQVSDSWRKSMTWQHAIPHAIWTSDLHSIHECPKPTNAYAMQNSAMRD